ncbi:galactokinase [Hymenobacter cheonanensis]|uniref:galactokinase n=1 Tax=Hymenobacter sp. CA2-7 TaxID=3063993 RepID=UPI002712E4FE|nr:galactokinase [Hymenobacter sp. CA2-7]MDO7884910.1 galactokinase [Hymenobacter sp. CA2-7]
MTASALTSAFEQRFGAAPTLLLRAPGRINLIGEHTDYNDGLVLPAAIDKEIRFALRLNGTDRIRLAALDFDDTYEVAVADIAPIGGGHWANYQLGVVAGLLKRGAEVPGFDCAFGGNIPSGAGLSSSAAAECGVAWGLNNLLGLKLDTMTLAHISQMAEHEYAKVMCGLMDQFASLFGRAGHVVELDCRSLDYKYFPFDTSACRLVLCNSGVKHALGDSEYNTRRRECAKGVEILQKHNPAIKSLRDATLADIEAAKGEIGEVVEKRCRYVVEENQRVQDLTARLAEGKPLAEVGELLYASHAGLRDLYQVSCDELDVLETLAHSAPGCYGARMMGGGFGGCTLNLVATDQVKEFLTYMKQGYHDQLGLKLDTYVTTLADGVGELLNEEG